MNSMSKKYYYDNGDYYEKHGRQCPTILKCGCPNGAITIRDGITLSAPVVLATVTLNIPKCCDSCVLLEYVSNVSFAIDTGEAPIPIGAIFTVTIFKNCSNNLRIAIGSYTYSKNFIANQAAPIINVVDTFSFFVCDCNNCASECCYYSAEIIASELIGFFSPVLLPTVTINNSTLAAIVTNSDCNF